MNTLGVKMELRWSYEGVKMYCVIYCVIYCVMYSVMQCVIYCVTGRFNGTIMHTKVFKQYGKYLNNRGREMSDELINE